MTDFSDIMDVMIARVPADVRNEVAKDLSHVRAGIMAMYVATGIEEDDIHWDKETQTGYVDRNLTNSQKYLTMLFSYESYLQQLKLTYIDESIGIKTLTFEIKSLDKRPDAVNDSLYQLKRWLGDEIKSVNKSGCIIGKARMMRSTNE